MRNIISLLIATCLLCSPAWAGAEKCILPEPDHRAEDTSPPSIKGKITSVHESRSGDLEVYIGASNKPQKVRIDDQTKIFTVYGGHVQQGELIPGLTVSVWFIAAVILPE